MHSEKTRKKRNKNNIGMWAWEKWCRETYAWFLSGTGAAGSPAFVGTSPWHLHWHRPESCAGKVGSPPPSPSSPPAAAAPARGQTGPKIHWSPPADRFAPAPGAARGLAPARRICPRWAAAAALFGHRPWRSAGRRGARSELGAKVVARLPSWSAEGGGDSRARSSVAFTPSPQRSAEEKRGERRGGGVTSWWSVRLCVHSPDTGHCPVLCGGVTRVAGLQWTRVKQESRFLLAKWWAPPALHSASASQTLTLAVRARHWSEDGLSPSFSLCARGGVSHPPGARAWLCVALCGSLASTVGENSSSSADVTFSLRWEGRVETEEHWGRLVVAFTHTLTHSHSGMCRARQQWPQ